MWASCGNPDNHMFLIRCVIKNNKAELLFIPSERGLKLFWATKTAAHAKDKCLQLKFDILLPPEKKGLCMAELMINLHKCSYFYLFIYFVHRIGKPDIWLCLVTDRQWHNFCSGTKMKETPVAVLSHHQNVLENSMRADKEKQNKNKTDDSYSEMKGELYWSRDNINWKYFIMVFCCNHIKVFIMTLYYWHRRAVINVFM